MSEKSDEVIGIQDEEDQEIKEGDNWKKLPYLKIFSMEYNQNNTLLVLGTNFGYRVFDVLNDFKLVSTVDENQKELGPLKRAKILYKSSLIGFIGARENKRFKENTLNIYSDDYQKILSKISFNQSIKNFYISSSLLFVCFISHIYVFELHSMKFIHNIPHCLFKENLFSITEDPLEENEEDEFAYNNKVITVAYVSSYQNDIKTQRYIINKNITNFVVKDEVISDFSECPEMIKLFKGFKMIVISKSGNKLHIYDYVNNSLLYCLNLGKGSLNIQNISFGLKNKFLLIHYNNYQFDLIKIKKEFERTQCTCGKTNKFGYKRLRTYDFGFNKAKIENSYCKGELLKGKGANEFCIHFDSKQKEIINIVDNGGNLTVYEFDRKEKGDKLKLVKKVSLFNDDSKDDF